MGLSAGLWLGSISADAGGARVVSGVGTSRGADESTTEGTDVAGVMDAALHPLNAARVSNNARMRVGITASFPDRIHAYSSVGEIV